MQGFPNGAQFSSGMLTVCGPMDCSTPGFPVQLVVKKTPANAGDKRLGFNSWVGKILWRTAWQPTSAFLPEQFHGQRSLEGYSP